MPFDLHLTFSPQFELFLLPFSFTITQKKKKKKLVILVSLFKINN